MCFEILGMDVILNDKVGKLYLSINSAQTLPIRS